jgi:hypothetical protein
MFIGNFRTRQSTRYGDSLRRFLTAECCPTTACLVGLPHSLYTRLDTSNIGPHHTEVLSWEVRDCDIKLTVNSIYAIAIVQMLSSLGSCLTVALPSLLLPLRYRAFTGNVRKADMQLTTP